MGKIVATAKIWNIRDEEDILNKRKHALEIRALVDSGATLLVLPEEVAIDLGLPMRKSVEVLYADGRRARRKIAIGVRIEIQGRQATCDAIVERSGTEPLIGQIPLEEMDLHLDLRGRTLRPNPKSPHAPLMDMLRAGKQPPDPEIAMR